MNNKIKVLIGMIAVLIVASLFGLVININFNGQTGDVTVNVEQPTIEYNEEEIPAVIEGDQGEMVETTEYEGMQIPTVEAIDGGGLFEDYQSVTEGLTTDAYYDLGEIEWVDTSSPEAFRDSTLGRCIIANNYYGAQCVSLARAFWWSYAGRDVSTCGTGLAKGMMDCYEQNAGTEFLPFWDVNYIQLGAWVILGGSYTGHVCFALGPVVNGHFACLGENQGGASCGPNIGGSATNIINVSVKDFIGGYMPISYIPPEPEPTPEPEPEPVVDKCKVWNVQKGDTLGAIMKTCRGAITWGQAMYDYANRWVSTKLKPGQTVFYGWTHGTGYGLLVDDVIEFVEGQ